MSKSYIDCQLKLAVSAVNQNRLTITQAAKEYSVPRTTLGDHVRNPELGIERGPSRLLSEEEENGLVNYLMFMGNQGFPMSRKMVRCYLQEFLKESSRAVALKLRENGPSDKWFRHFNKRHPELSERLPEDQDKARTRMSNGPIVDRFFDFFQTVVADNGLENKPEQIFNCDETGWSTKEKNRQKVYGRKKGHLFRQRVFAGDHITAHLCCSAAGVVLPPMLIFKGGLPHRDFKDGVPGNWLFSKSETGYMDTELFEEWFKKGFLPNCGKSRPVLLLMDNHDSHISKGVVEAARKNDIVLVGLPSHTTHILQPLDVHFIGPLKEKVSTMAVNLGFGNQSMVIGKSKFPSLLSQAIDQICASTVKEAFRQSGIYPVNRLAIDRSQLVGPMFIGDHSRSTSPPPETCGSCGQFVGVNPLVKRGLIPANMASIFLPPPSKTEKKTSRRKVVTEGRVISSEEMMNFLKEKEENEIRKKEAQELRQKERDLKREQKLTEHVEASKRRKQSGVGAATCIRVATEDFQMDSSSEEIDGEDDNTLCCVCNERQPLKFRQNDYVEFLKWGQCSCGHWTHLKYCSTVTAIRRDAIFQCPHCLH